MRYALFSEITRSIVAIIYRRLGQKALKDGNDRCFETSMNNYQYTLRNYVEERRSIFIFRSVF